MPRQGRGLKRIEVGRESADVDSLQIGVTVGGTLGAGAMGQPGMHSVANIHHRQSSAVMSGPNRSMPGTAMTNREGDLPNTSDAQSIEFKVA